MRKLKLPTPEELRAMTPEEEKALHERIRKLKLPTPEELRAMTPEEEEALDERILGPERHAAIRQQAQADVRSFVLGIANQLAPAVDADQARAEWKASGMTKKAWVSANHERYGVAHRTLLNAITGTARQ